MWRPTHWNCALSSRIMQLIVIALLSQKMFALDDRVELSCLIGDIECEDFEHHDVKSHCLSGTCVCMNTTSGANVPCTPKVSDRTKRTFEAEFLTNYVGGQCPCTIANTVCHQQSETNLFCTCAEGFTISADRRRCLPERVALGGECELPSQCRNSNPFSNCSESMHKCMCDPLHARSAGDKCLGLLNHICYKNADCQAFNNSRCIADDMKCGCYAKYVPDAVRRTCLPLGHIGDPCSETRQCQLGVNVYATCKVGVCVCGPGSRQIFEYNDRSTCKPLAQFGDFCRNDKDCELHHEDQTKNMVCMVTDCRCRLNYKFDNGECIPSGSEATHLPLSFYFIYVIIMLILKIHYRWI